MVAFFNVLNEHEIFTFSGCHHARSNSLVARLEKNGYHIQLRRSNGQKENLLLSALTHTVTPDSLFNLINERDWCARCCVERLQNRHYRHHINIKWSLFGVFIVNFEHIQHNMTYEWIMAFNLGRISPFNLHKYFWNDNDKTDRSDVIQTTCGPLESIFLVAIL